MGGLFAGRWVVFPVGADGSAELAAWDTDELWAAFLELSETYRRIMDCFPHVRIIFLWIPKCDK